MQDDMPRHFHDVAGGVSDDVSAVDNVLLHHAEFLGGESARLFDDLLGNHQLADVVQHSGNAERLKLLLVFADEFTHHTRILGNAADMLTRLLRGVFGDNGERIRQLLLRAEHIEGKHGVVDDGGRAVGVNIENFLHAVIVGFNILSEYGKSGELSVVIEADIDKALSLLGIACSAVDMLCHLESRVMEFKTDVVAKVAADVVGIAVAVDGIEMIAVKHADRTARRIFRLEHERQQIGEIGHETTGKHLHIARAHQILRLAHNQLNAAGHSADFVGIFNGVGEHLGRLPGHLTGDKGDGEEENGSRERAIEHGSLNGAERIIAQQQEGAGEIMPQNNGGNGGKDRKMNQLLVKINNAGDEREKPHHHHMVRQNRIQHDHDDQNIRNHEILDPIAVFLKHIGNDKRNKEKDSGRNAGDSHDHRRDPENAHLVQNKAEQNQKTGKETDLAKALIGSCFIVVHEFGRRQINVKPSVNPLLFILLVLFIFIIHRLSKPPVKKS